MKTNKLLFGILFALVAVAVFSSAAKAAELIDYKTISIDDNEVASGDTVAVMAGETVDLRVSFIALEDEQDVKVKAWIEGYRDDIEFETQRFDIVKDRTYTKKLSLSLPLDFNASDDYKLMVRVAGKNAENQVRFQLTLQRPSYDLEILSVEYVREVESGDALLATVVVKNRGSHKLQDVYIKGRIADLGIEKTIYAGDLLSTDRDETEKDDAVEKTLSLVIPKGSKSGTYDLSVSVYNDEMSTSKNSKVTVKGATAGTSSVEVVTAQLSKEVGVGGSVVYKLELVNPTDEAQVITIGTSAALENAGIKVTANPSVVTVPANSAETVEVTVEAADATQTGSYSVPVTIKSGDEETGKQVGITANVVKSAAGVKNPVLTLTVVLGVILIVLLIVLFTSVRKPEKMGEEETAYY